MMGYGFMQDGLSHVRCVSVVRQYHVDLPRSGIIPALGRGLFPFKSFGAFMHDYSADKVEILGGFLRGLAFGFGRGDGVRGVFHFANNIQAFNASCHLFCMVRSCSTLLTDG